MPNIKDFPNQIFGFNFTEYLTIFVALVFALAVGEFFISLGNLIRNRDRVRIHREFVAWLFIILNFFIISWFTYWPRLMYLRLSLLNYFVVILPYLVIYIIVAVYFPEVKHDKDIDLKAHFMSIRKILFLLWGSYLLINALIDYFLPTYFTGLAVGEEVLFAALLLVAAFYNRVWYRSVVMMIFLTDMIFALMWL